MEEHTASTWRRLMPRFHYLDECGIRDVVMNRSDIEKLTDELIGEAVLSLLSENGPVNTRALITRLQSMEAKEKDIRRRETLGRVIAEITNNAKVSMRRHSGREQKDSENEHKDNVFQLFGTSQQKSTSKKH
ncbi:hypothetical protein [Pseudescherichia sp.]|uniref:hypothetical protein n=2 Tax=Pseudescherichia TaxID=2055880 RepID=UPI003917D9CD